LSPWDKLKSFTAARVGLGRQGSALPTRHVLEFQRAHAAARSAVWQNWAVASLQENLLKHGDNSLILHSEVSDREDYLRYPSKGRALHPQSKALLQATTVDLVFVVSDGLSALAIDNHFLTFWQRFQPMLKRNLPELTWQLFLVPFGRVAISDPIGEAVGAKLSVIFIGERPGLKSPDSLGFYMTFHPRIGNSDAHRNCISNVRSPNGLPYELAADMLLYLMNESLRLQLSGVDLKNDFQTNALPTS
jgi:ethanolamine ammonia-lyase small subunit